MDNLETLFNKKQYELIISLSENTSDINALLYRINAFIALNKYQGALAVFNNPAYQEIIYKNNPLKCMELHFALLLHEGKYSEAFDALKRYENYPYVSQEVEEYLHSVAKKITKAQENEIKKTCQYEEEEIIHAILEESDASKIINYLYYLKKIEIAPYLEAIKHLLKRVEVRDDVKTFALLLLIAKNVNQNVTLVKKKQTYELNPSQLEPPYIGKKYQKVINNVIKLAKDPSLENVAINLFNQYLMNIYPLNPYQEKSDKVALAFYILAHKYLKTSTDLLEISQNSPYDIKEVMQLVANIEENI